jgi:hypothetical protein
MVEILWKATTALVFFSGGQVLEGRVRIAAVILEVI